MPVYLTLQLMVRAAYHITAATGSLLHYLFTVTRAVAPSCYFLSRFADRHRSLPVRKHDALVARTFLLAVTVHPSDGMTDSLYNTKIIHYFVSSIMFVFYFDCNFYSTFSV